MELVEFGGAAVVTDDPAIGIAHVNGGRQRIQQPFGRVKFTIAHHSSSMPDGSYGGVPGGWLLTLSGARVYFACDTALFLDMKLIGAGGLGATLLTRFESDLMPDARVAAQQPAASAAGPHALPGHGRGRASR